MPTMVPDRGDDPKRKGNPYLSAKKYSKLKYASEYLDDSGISDDYMGQLDKELKRRPGKFGK